MGYIVFIQPQLQFDKAPGWNIEDVNATYFLFGAKVLFFIWTITINCIPPTTFPHPAIKVTDIREKN